MSVYFFFPGNIGESGRVSRLQSTETGIDSEFWLQKIGNKHGQIISALGAPTPSSVQWTY